MTAMFVLLYAGIAVVALPVFIVIDRRRQAIRETEPQWVMFSRWARDCEKLAEVWDGLGEQELAASQRDLSRTYQESADTARGLNPEWAESRRKTGNCVKCGAVATWLDLGYDKDLCTRCGQEEHACGPEEPGAPRELDESLPPGAPEGYEQFKRRWLADQEAALRRDHPTWQKWANDEFRAEIRQTIADFKTGLHTDRRSKDGFSRCYCKQCWADQQMWQFWGPDSWRSRQERERLKRPIAPGPAAKRSLRESL